MYVFRIIHVCFILRTLAFLMLPKGERKWVFLKSQIIFSSFKIKHKFKKKGGERDE